MQGLTVVIRRDPPHGFRYTVTLSIPGIQVELRHSEGHKATEREAWAAAQEVVGRALDKLELFRELIDDDSTPDAVIVDGNGVPLSLERLG